MNRMLSTLTRLLAVFIAIGLFSCDGGSSETGAGGELPGRDEPCEPSEGCRGDLICSEGSCAAAPDAGGMDAGEDGGDGGLCFDGRPLCGGTCCGASQVCEAGACVRDCGDQIACDGMCCEGGEVCEQGQCRAPCDGQRCGAAMELCCEGESICFAESCVQPGDPCERNEDCALDELCEPMLGRCLPRENVDVCEFRPPVAEFTPRLGCRWTPADTDADVARDDLVATPVIGNLTDDNDDGRTDTDDIPDIAFLTYDLSVSCCNVPATLRVVDGRCNDDGTMNTLASLSDPPMDNSSGLALGDLTGDGVPELVALGMYNRSGNNPRPQGAMAWIRAANDGSRWQLLWENTQYPTWNVHTRGGSLASIADLDGDGQPEVIIGNVVLNGQDGSLIWDGAANTGGEGGVGNNAFLGPSSTVADIDLDGQQEVLAGNTSYSASGEELWTYQYTSSNSPCGGSLPCDGFTAAGNFDDDDEAEVVIVRLGEVFVLQHDGSLLWKQAIPTDDCAENESGPPTIADFDGDGRSEIGTAAADFYAVVDMDCDADPVPEGCAGRGVLWRVPNQDCSSRVTASSVFDFEGDGRAEMVYADETTFRIFDGTTGEILYEDDTHGSHTRIEMPVVADVDNDGNAEVVIPENGSRGGTPGLEVWEDADDNWVRTRRIWNQHNYHVTNVEENGTIPAQPEPNWLNPRLNNFRQNLQPSGLFDAPDLVVRDIEVDTSDCSRTFEVDVAVVVANEGALGVAPGIPVRIEGSFQDDFLPLGTPVTTQRLLPGQSERLQLTWEISEDQFNTQLEVRATVDPDMATNECIEDNNTASLSGEESFECRFVE